jgi:hypothetical protein
VHVRAASLTARSERDQVIQHAVHILVLKQIGDGEQIDRLHANVGARVQIRRQLCATTHHINTHASHTFCICLKAMLPSYGFNGSRCGYSAL